MAYRKYGKYTRGEVRALLAGIADEDPEQIADYEIILHIHGDGGKCQTVVMGAPDNPASEMGLLVSGMQAVLEDMTGKETTQGDGNT